MSERDRNLLGAMQGLVEAQRAVDRQARAAVKGVRKMIDAHETIEPKAAIEFPRLDPKFYDTIESLLVAEGFRTLGDFQPAGTSEKPPEQRTHYRAALGDEGRVAATWFMVPRKAPKEPLRCVVVQSFLEDGRDFVTGSGLTESGLPGRPGNQITYLPADTPVPDLVRTHRASVVQAGAAPRALHSADEMFAARLDDEQRTRAFREQQGPALVEPVLRKMMGARFEEDGRMLLEAFHAHPEWWTGEVVLPPLTYLMSRDEKTGRVHVTTAGMLAIGLPELQMKEVASNHCVAARKIMTAVANVLAADESLQDAGAEVGQRLSGRTLTLTPDPKAPNLSAIPGRPEVKETGPVQARLVLEGFAGKKHGLLSFLRESDPQLLHVVPAGGAATNKDRWLRDACRSLGYAAPEPRPPAALPYDMKTVSRAARERLPKIREQFLAGLPAGQTVLVKQGLPVASGHEYVWISVQGWTPDGAITGRLESEPQGTKGFTRGQEMRLREDDVFDIAISRGSEGLVEPAYTDVVAQEYGVDLRE